jgi:hypothetical protein
MRFSFEADGMVAVLCVLGDARQRKARKKDRPSARKTEGKPEMMSADSVSPWDQ